MSQRGIQFTAILLFIGIYLVPSPSAGAMVPAITFPAGLEFIGFPVFSRVAGWLPVTGETSDTIKDHGKNTEPDAAKGLLLKRTGNDTIRAVVEVTMAGKGKVDTRIDNMGYWRRMMKKGYVLPSPKTEVAPGTFTGTKIRAYEPVKIQNAKCKMQNQASGIGNWELGIREKGSHFPFSIVNCQLSIVNYFFNLSSPDIPVTGETEVTQSENSVFIDPQDESVALSSNNSSSWIVGFAEDLYGADALHTSDWGMSWQGTTRGAGGTNQGDPATAIGNNGWWYVGKIDAGSGQSVSYSKNKGQTWTRVVVANGPVAGDGLLDKNHLWIDNTPGSPYEGYLYDAWTNFMPGSPDSLQIQVSRSANHGLSWSSPVGISQGAGALNLNHGVNLHTGPSGEVYAVWSIYDAWPADETAIGFSKSLDGGGIFTPAVRIINNIKGIRASLTAKQMRVNAFPSMAVDNSTGPHRGTLYVVFPNVGFPGINTGSDIDIYLIRSADGGDTWSAPVRVNQDPPGLGKQHFFPWITCDPVTGGLCVVYYDDRNAGPGEVAVFVSCSWDGGLSWTDFQVSDYQFTPAPIPGLPYNYFGDYIGIQSRNMKVYPIFTSNHQGRAMSYVSPFDLGPNPNQPWVVYYSDSLAPVPLLKSPVTGTAITGQLTTSAGFRNRESGGLTFGDSLYLTLGLKNIGDQPAQEVTATLSSPSPLVEITDSTAFYGAIAAGAVGTALNGFTLKVSDTIPDGVPVRFDVRASTPDSAWNSHFAVESGAPAPRITGLSVNDSAGGNSNGRLDPGETVELIFTNKNSGDFSCLLTSGRLTILSPYLTLLSDSIFLGTLLPGAVKPAAFTAVVDADAPLGSAVDLYYRLISGGYNAHGTFREIIGVVAEDWESNSFTRFPWQQMGTLPWTITNVNPWEGAYCAQSGSISDYQSSQMFVTYESAADDSISFFLRTSSEPGYDFLFFQIDNVTQGQWSGETPWTRVAFPVAAGSHQYKWIYRKDLAFTYGLDKAWVDFIAFPPPVLPAVDPGPADTLCAGKLVPLQATASQYDSIRWTTLGDGLFANDTTLNTVYTPGTFDIIEGTATLRLTGYGKYGSMAKNKVITIRPLPHAFITVSPYDTVCAGNAIFLSADTAGIATYRWIPGGMTMPEIMVDTAATGGMGSYWYRLTVTNRFSCSAKDSVVITFKNCTGIEEPQLQTIRVWPNPGDGRFLIGMHTLADEPVTLTIHDANGSVVFHEIIHRHPATWIKKINLNAAPDGVYLLTVTTSGTPITRKLIIRKQAPGGFL